MKILVNINIIIIAISILTLSSCKVSSPLHYNFDKDIQEAINSNNILLSSDTKHKNLSNSKTYKSLMPTLSLPSL